ncbi:hypothetical protein C7B82_09720 [Stenomitos frigidus ULC18]|uniref:Uncharacterized protein n=1 Tax=Stenomitos frigidus ULC18 TaxID=2107698 RepID=A0A2T1EBD2_9CYAN|nr:hypothetical protein C7B82_09720 [Stenomitos frigidus ULC18]
MGSFRHVLLSLPDKHTGNNTCYKMEDAALSAFSRLPYWRDRLTKHAAHRAIFVDAPDRFAQQIGD